MKSKIFLLMALFGIVVSCQPKNQTESPEVLKQVLFNFYDGIKNKDFDRIKETVTPDFRAFIDGKVWSTDSVINTLNSYPPYKAEYSFDNFKINLADSLGCINYFIHCDFVMNDTLKLKFDWLESATFIKVDNQWKMNFMHTTTKL